MSIELSEQEIFRRQSLNELRNLGIDPYPAALYPTNAYSDELKLLLKMKIQKSAKCVLQVEL